MILYTLRLHSHGVGKLTAVQAFVGDFFDRDSASLANDKTKDIVAHLPTGPVESSVFKGRCDTTGESPVDVDVLYTPSILVVSYRKSDGGTVDDFPHCQTDALQRQDYVDVITECMVLRQID